MSKAFTRDEEAPAVEPSALGRLPHGVPNYVTARGRERLIARITMLAERGAQTAARGLAERLERAQPIAPRASGDAGPVRFGDRVTVKGERLRALQIVGVDEADLASEIPGVELLSWLTPLAKALIGAEIGDIIDDGADELEILAVEPGNAEPA